MGKARNKSKKGGMKRLVNESLLLSSTRFVSSRLVQLFEAGLFSPLLTSVKTVDRFCKDKVARPLFKKLELRKNFTVPVRNRFASLLGDNGLFRRLSLGLKGMLNVSLRSLGIFLLTFGIYSGAIFLLKRYVSVTLGDTNVNDLAAAAITIITGLLLTLFGDKSIISALGSGRITGSALSNSLGINDSTFDRAPKIPPTTSAGMSFLWGSLFGVLTFFASPIWLLSVLGMAAIFVTILNVPEFGLLLAIFTFSFSSVEFVSFLAISVVLSHFIKWLRLKRNLRFGTADVAMALFMASMFLSSLGSDQEVDKGEFYLLMFIAIYFSAKNLICSGKLLYQSFSAACNGMAVGMAVYILGEYAHLIPNAQLRDGAIYLSSNALDGNMMAMLVSAMLPFALFLMKYQKKGTVFAFLALGCAIITDSVLVYILILSALFAYIAFGYKAPAGAAASAAIVMVPLITILSEWAISDSVKAFTSNVLDSVLDKGIQSVADLWAGLKYLGGGFAVFIFGVALILVLQRAFGSIAMTKSDSLVCIIGTVAASSVMMTVSGFLFNPFSDIRTVLAMFFVFGLCGSVYKVCLVSQSGSYND